MMYNLCVVVYHKIFSFLSYTRHTWLLGSVYRGSSHRGYKSRGAAHAPGPPSVSQAQTPGLSPASGTAVGTTQGPDVSAPQNLGRKTQLNSSNSSPCSSLTKSSSFRAALNSASINIPSVSPSLSSYSTGNDNQHPRASDVNTAGVAALTPSSSSSVPSMSPSLSPSYSSGNDNQLPRPSDTNTAAGGLSSSSVNNGNIGDDPELDNNNCQQLEEEPGRGCVVRADSRTRSSIAGNPSQLSPSTVHSKLPVCRVVKGITNSNQLFHYRFSPV